MQTTILPHTNLEVSRLCMGTMTFGAQATELQARRMVDRCLDEGINFFDTANVYNQGRSEEILGKALGPKRSEVVLASKVRGAMGDPPDYSGLAPHAIQRGIDDTLRRLGTDYLDIYYLHQPDYDTPIEETLEALERLRQSGKIRYGGTSNYSAWQLCEILWTCEKQGCQPLWVSQPMYNLLARGIDQEYLAFTERYKIGVVCYNPLAGGLLTGKHDGSRAPAPGTRFDGNQMYLKRYWHPEYFNAVQALEGVAGSCGKTLVELALTWVLQRPDVDSVILGASKIEQLDANLRAAKSEPLEPSVLAACDEIWRNLHGPVPTYNR